MSEVLGNLAWVFVGRSAQYFLADVVVELSFARDKDNTNLMPNLGCGHHTT